MVMRPQGFHPFGVGRSAYARPMKKVGGGSHPSSGQEVLGPLAAGGQGRSSDPQRQRPSPMADNLPTAPESPIHLLAGGGEVSLGLG
jgi:hypothetical protein